MTCERKVFISRKRAKKKKKQFEATYGKKLKIYKCKTCDRYHLTSHTRVEDAEYYRTKYIVKK